jgi:benzylsuccinate CoA-transferase BbsE subunit
MELVGAGRAAGDGSGPLARYRVLDLTGELGWLCGRIFADLGADVIKVEPPGGEPGRLQPPCLEGRDGPLSVAWLAYNVGKRGVVLDLETAHGLDAFRRLIETADFLIESETPGRLDGLGAGWESVNRWNPRLVMTSIRPYGRGGPSADSPAGDLEIMAASGAVWLAGDQDRPPVRVTLPQAAGWASMHAAAGTLIAHYARQLSGRGQHVDCSAQAAVMHAISQAPIYWDMLRQNPGRGGPYLTARNIHGAPIRQIWECADGYVTFALYGGAAGHQSNRQLVAWMEERGMCPDFMRAMDWDSFEVAAAGLYEVQRLEQAIAPFVRGLTRREFFEEVLARRILGYPVATVADIAADEQLQARGVWQALFQPDLGMELILPSGYARMGAWTNRHRRPAPMPGEHSREILFEELGLAPKGAA